MVRWVRIVAIAGVSVAFIAVGGAVGLILVSNDRWVTVLIPAWLVWLFGERPLEVWLPALIGGWVVSHLAVALLLMWSMYYVWRRRQYERLVARLEKELTALRNLPLERPAPLEDLPELDADDDASAAELGERGRHLHTELQRARGAQPALPPKDAEL
jgi:hypothetical protein